MAYNKSTTRIEQNIVWLKNYTWNRCKKLHNHAQLYTYIGESALCGYRDRLEQGFVHCRVRIRAHTCVLVISMQCQTLLLALSGTVYAAFQDIVEVALRCKGTHRVISIHDSSFLSKLQYLIDAPLKDLQLHQTVACTVHRCYECLQSIYSVHYHASTTITHTNKAHVVTH